MTFRFCHMKSMTQRIASAPLVQSSFEIKFQFLRSSNVLTQPSMNDATRLNTKQDIFNFS